MDWFDTILQPLMVAVAWVMIQFHSLLTTLGLPSASGVTWALSIVGLVITIRILLIPLFVKQIKASRGMQLLAPEMQVIQKKYKGKTDPASREAMSRETMELYRKHGTNPFSSCLPILAQSPIFFALFRVLYNLGKVADGSYAKPNIGPLTQELAHEANAATIFDAPISSFFLSPDADTSTRIVSVALIVLMSATTFTTQRQLTQKNMPASALQGPMAQQQKMLLYILPLVFAISGVNFPIGVLIYWSTTNLWSMGQQFYVIRRNPTPGSEAERLLKERRARKAAAKGIVLEEAPPAIEDKPRGQRDQPKRKERAKGTVAGTTPADGVAVTRPATGPKPKTAGAKPAGPKAAGTKPAGPKAAGTKPAAAARAGGKPAGATSATDQPAKGGSVSRDAVDSASVESATPSPVSGAETKRRIARAGGSASTGRAATTAKRPGSGTSAARRAAASASGGSPAPASSDAAEGDVEPRPTDGSDAPRTPEN